MTKNQLIDKIVESAKVYKFRGLPVDDFRSEVKSHLYDYETFPHMKDCLIQESCSSFRTCNCNEKCKSYK